MEGAVFLNRRSGTERRHYDQSTDLDRRHNQRRELQASPYVLVVGRGGIDRMGLVVMVGAVLLIAAALIGSLMAA